jgi:exopolysaccharide biosynthesis polyprenyl glycosylphosphotransferase
MIAVRAVQRSNLMETTVLSRQPPAEENAVALPQRSALGKVAEQEWAPGLLFFLLDVIFWVAIYGSFSFLRHDAYSASAFEFAIVDIIQLGIIIQALYVIGGYSSRVEMLGLTYTAEHIIALLSALGVSALILYGAATYDHTMKPSRSVVLASFIAFTPISMFYRRALRKRVAAAAANRAFLVIGSGDLAANFYRTYRSSPNQQRLEFVGVDQARIGQGIAGLGTPVIEGDLSSKLGEVSKRYSGIILAEKFDRLPPELLQRLIRAQFQRTRVYTIESFYEAQWRRVPMHSVDPFWPLQSGFQLSRASPYHYVKRLFDMGASLLGLVLGLPLMAIIALLIWITSGRPIIFKQSRVGRDEDLFTIYKFRTMIDAGAEAEAELYTREDDPRVLRLGRWLRKLRVDELPQLWNVFKGELSLIGPRAEWVECAERYQKKIPFYHFRHLVKPGITGWAQVNYPYGESEKDAVEKLKYDLYYIRHYSLMLDAMIVLKTIHTMLFGKGR